MSIDNLVRKLDKIHEGDKRKYLESLKNANPSAYKNLKKLYRIFIWKTRKSKFRRYYNNFVKYIKS